MAACRADRYRRQWRIAWWPAEAGRGCTGAGARLIVGTDAEVTRGKLHEVLPHGLIALAALGLSNIEVLRTATAHAAEAYGVSGRKGRLTPGADSDLLAVKGNPLRDLRALTEVQAVFRVGHQIR